MAEREEPSSRSKGKASKKVTIQDVASAAGVSVATVSNYLNDYPYMRAATREKVQTQIDRLGYVVNEAARNFRSGRTKLFLLSIPDLTQIYFAELAEQVIRAARAKGYGVIVESTGQDYQREIDSIRSMATGISDGLILSPTQMTDSDISYLEGDFPLVVLGESVFSAPAPHILIGNVIGARMATRHLITSGCKTVVLVGGTLDSKKPSSRSLRTQGYRVELEAEGQAFRPDYVLQAEQWTSQDGAKAVRAMLEKGIHPDGIFALNDLLATGVISQLTALGIRVPEDVRVVGFDNIDEAKYTVPALTTVDPDRAAVADYAVNSLLEQIKNGHRAPKRSLPVSCSLVLRDSSPKV